MRQYKPKALILKNGLRIKLRGVWYKECDHCYEPFIAAKGDAKWCSKICGHRDRNERKKFDARVDSKCSPCPGIRWERFEHRWQVRVRDPLLKYQTTKWRYVGSAGTVEEAIALQADALANPEKYVRVRKFDRFKFIQDVFKAATEPKPGKGNLARSATQG